MSPILVICSVFRPRAKRKALATGGDGVPQKNEAVAVDTVLGGTLVIGGHIAGGVKNYHGKLDEIRIYNRPLSASEVYHLYNPDETNGNDSPPTIISQPVADQNATIGSNINFNVEANGTGPTSSGRNAMPTVPG